MNFFCEDHLRPMVPPLLDWYRANQKPLPWRTDRTPYHVWISEIMLQQTRIEAVIPYYFRFLAELPDIPSLAACPDDRLMKLWEGLGYYSRVRNLRRAAQVIMENFNGEMPHTVAGLRSLPGIGDYTAGAIASIAFGEPAPAVDGNVLRVVMRLTGADYDIAQPKVKGTVTSLLAGIYPSGEAAGELTEGLMELGEVVCIPNGEPKCGVCPLKDFCVAHREGLTSCLPVKSARAERREESKTVLLLFSGGRIAIRKRAPGGLLANLWELPTLEGHLSEKEVCDFLRRSGSEVLSVEPCGKTSHIFTHLVWNMIGYRIVCAAPSQDYLWVLPQELESLYALPSAFRYYRKQV